MNSTRLSRGLAMMVAAFFSSAAVTACQDGSITDPQAGSNPIDQPQQPSQPSDTTSPVTPPPAGGGIRAGYYASPSGSSSADGSYANPWDLRTALAGGNGRVTAGDTVWLRGGRYVGSFRTTVSGQAGRPVVFRQYPGERATIDGAGTPGGAQSIWYVGGSHTVHWGFEITNSDANRSTTQLGNGVRPNMVANYASHTKFINLVVHDGGVAFYTEPMYTNVEFVGNVVYNNGWQSTDRGHGHAIYVKSNNGPVTVRDNVMFNQFSYGVHVYSNAGSGDLNNIRIEGNVSFNNGTLSNNSTSANILVGGEATATDDVIHGNMTYYSPGQGGTNVAIGYQTTANGRVTVTDNYVVGGARALTFGYWDQAQVTGNTLIGGSTMVTLADNSLSGHSWSGQAYSRGATSTAWSFQGTSAPLATWHSNTGLGTTGTAGTGDPTSTRVFVRANQYEAGRANVVVYNWGNQGSVSVNLSGIVPNGARYQVHAVQNMYGAPVASGTYGGGSVSIPVTSQAAPAAIGWTAGAATGTAFNVYVVTLAD